MPRPIDLYLEFNPHFFTPPDKRNEAAQKYITSLSQQGDLIDEVLQEPTALLQGQAVYDSLYECMKYEYFHSLNLRKPKYDTPDQEKPSGGLKITRDDLIQKAGVSLRGAQKNYTTGRVSLHLTRLIFPEEYAERLNLLCGITEKPQNDYCEGFALDLIRYFATTPEEIDDSSPETTDAGKLKAVAGMEGDAIIQFWTLAPYIHLNLKERGLTAKESAGRIVEWAQSGHVPRGSAVDAVLDHIERLNDILTFPLGYDQRMPSHLKARLMSRFVAEKLAEK